MYASLIKCAWAGVLLGLMCAPGVGGQCAERVSHRKEATLRGPVTSLFVDVNVLVAGSYCNGAILVCPMGSGKELHFGDYGSSINALAVFGGGRLLASSSGGGEVRVRQLWTGKTVGRYRLPEEHGAAIISSVAFSADGKKLAAGFACRLASDEHQWLIAVWDVLAPESASVFRVPRLAEMHIAFSPNGRILLSGDVGGPYYLWDVGTGSQICRLNGYEGETGCPSFTHDSKMLVAVGEDAMLHYWETATGRERLKMNLGARPCSPAVFSASGNKVAFVTADNQIGLYSPDRAKNAQLMNGHDGRTIKLSFSWCGQFLASGCENGHARVWAIQSEAFSRKSQVAYGESKVQQLWKDLANENAGPAYRALRLLSACSEEDFALLRKQIRPIAGREEIREWIARLDAEQFSSRQDSIRQLEKLGRLAKPAFDKALRSNPSPEMRRSVELLISRLEKQPLGVEELRLLRTIELCEASGSAEALKTLHILTHSKYAATVVEEAVSAIERLRGLNHH